MSASTGVLLPTLVWLLQPLSSPMPPCAAAAVASVGHSDVVCKMHATYGNVTPHMLFNELLTVYSY